MKYLYDRLLIILLSIPPFFYINSFVRVETGRFHFTDTITATITKHQSRFSFSEGSNVENDKIPERPSG